MNNLEWLWEHDRDKLRDLGIDGDMSCYDCPNGCVETEEGTPPEECQRRLVEWLMAEHIYETNGIGGETNGIRDEITLPEGDVVAILRKAASYDGDYSSPSEALRRLTDSTTVYFALETLADMVERDYVKRESIEGVMDTDRELVAENIRLTAERDEWKAKAEAKSAKRAAAVERLKNSEYHTALDDVCAMLGWGHEPHFEGATAALIDLLTDDESCRQDANQGERDRTPDCESYSREKLEADIWNFIEHNGWFGYEYEAESYADCRKAIFEIFKEWLDLQAAITEREWESEQAYINAGYKEQIAELTAERDMYREKLSRALDMAHEIGRLMP